MNYKMAEYSVKVRVTKVLEKPMKIFASSAEAAEERAAEIVGRWADIEEAEGFDAEEVISWKAYT